MNLDFFSLGSVQIEKYRLVTVYPEFLVKKSKDLMIRGGKFYAVINKNTGFWETDESIIQEYVDEELDRCAEKKKKEFGSDYKVETKSMMKYRSKSWTEYKNYISSLPDNYHQLDDKLCFADQVVKKRITFLSNFLIH